MKRLLLCCSLSLLCYTAFSLGMHNQETLKETALQEIAERIVTQQIPVEKLITLPSDLAVAILKDIVCNFVTPDHEKQHFVFTYITNLLEAEPEAGPNTPVIHELMHLICFNTQFNYKNKVNNPLGFALRYGYDKVAYELLCSYGADPNISFNPKKSNLYDPADTPLYSGSFKNIRMTPLFWATVYNNNAFLKLCLEKKAFVRCTLESGSDRAHHPLIQAAYNNNKEAVELLLQHGAQVNGCWNGHDNCPVDSDFNEICDTTVVSKAASCKNYAMICLLAQKGARLSSTDLRECILDDQPIDIFLHYGLPINTRFADGNTLLTLMTACNNTEAVKKLLEHGADPHLITDYNETALSIAQAEGNQALIELLESYQ